VSTAARVLIQISFVSSVYLESSAIQTTSICSARKYRDTPLPFKTPKDSRQPKVLIANSNVLKIKLAHVLVTQAFLPEHGGSLASVVVVSECLAGFVDAILHAKSEVLVFLSLSNCLP
jgi:hypothetical protein